MRIGDLTWSNPTPPSAEANATPTTEGTAPLKSNRDIAESVKVSLSERAERTQQSRSTEDIDDSDLPQLIKRLLKQIRELKQQIAELQQQMAELARQQGLTDEERATRLDALRTELTSLSSALTSAYSALAKAMKQQNLSDEQRTSVLQLMNA
ncbi:hypothetical protein [Pseudomonas sp.]|uniref:hypothetical protein n=1 Tax=Pseudomonas sp. TaxID=306 RepID=UPI00324281DB